MARNKTASVSPAPKGAGAVTEEGGAPATTQTPPISGDQPGSGTTEQIGGANQGAAPSLEGAATDQPINADNKTGGEPGGEGSGGEGLGDEVGSQGAQASLNEGAAGAGREGQDSAASEAQQALQAALAERDRAADDAGEIDEVDLFQQWCESRDFPAEIVMRNHGMSSAAVAVTGSFLLAGGSATVTVMDEGHAAEVMSCLAEINASQAGFALISIDGVPDELVTMKGD